MLLGREAVRGRGGRTEPGSVAGAQYPGELWRVNYSPKWSPLGVRQLELSYSDTCRSLASVMLRNEM